MKYLVWDFYLAMIEHNEITLEKRNQSKVVRSFALPKRTATQPEKSHNYMLIANGIFYNGTEAEKVYLGENLVWEKSGKPVVSTHTIMGKFSDDSTEADWKCIINSNTVTLPVDPVTKEFGYDIKGNKVNRVSSMFCDCSKLISLDLSNLVYLSDGLDFLGMWDMFNDCSALTTLNLSGWNISKTPYMNNTFYHCYTLTTVLGPITGIGASWTNATTLNLCHSPLTNASAMVFINGLAEVTTAKSIEFKASTYDTLTDEQIAVATSKGWNVVRYAY